jgi:hypothetical protein
MRGTSAPADIATPQRVEAEVQPAGRVISWEPVLGASRYHVLRLGIKKLAVPAWPIPMVSSAAGGSPRLAAPPGDVLEVGPREAFSGAPRAADTPTIDVAIPEPFNAVPIASPTTTSYVDVTPLTDPYLAYQYMIVAETFSGQMSARSNVAQAPSPTPPMTLRSFDAFVDGLELRGVLRPSSPPRQFVDQLTTLVQADDIDGAIERTLAFRKQLVGLFPGFPLLTEDMGIMTGKLLRRLSLAQSGAISLSTIIR